MNLRWMILLLFVFVAACNSQGAKQPVVKQSEYTPTPSAIFEQSERVLETFYARKGDASIDLSFLQNGFDALTETDQEIIVNLADEFGASEQEVIDVLLSAPSIKDSGTP